MKILIVLPRVPYPLEKGDKLRAYHQLRILSKRHQIALFCLSDSRLHPDALEHLKAYCTEIHIHQLTAAGKVFNMLKACISGKPLQAGYFYSASAHRQLLELISRFRPDHLYCQLLRSAAYLVDVNIKKTIDYQDVFSIGLARRMKRVSPLIRWVFRMEYKRMLRYERAMFDRFDHCTIISEPDRDLIPHPDRARMVIVPNGVNFEYFSPQTRAPVYDLLFTGNMGYPPNIDSAEYLVKEILPLIHRIDPAVTLLIAGANPHKRVKALAGEMVTIAGWVPDMRDCYAQSRVFIAPMRIGTGLQNKLLEAMAMELPCITSELANAALMAAPGEEILVGTDTASYAALTMQLLRDHDFAMKTGRSGSRYVRDHFDWEVCTRKLENLITSDQ
ncbi:MAG TPA: glycosyltransferase [Bacteroidales bacterium]|nr:glycosyltransferase [Bacteroidales bacterium]HSA42906.1 glycosyltransferase [Bacteroidales bacterium]